MSPACWGLWPVRLFTGLWAFKYVNVPCSLIIFFLSVLTIKVVLFLFILFLNFIFISVLRLTSGQLKLLRQKRNSRVLAAKSSGKLLLRLRLKRTATCPVGFETLTRLSMTNFPEKFKITTQIPLLMPVSKYETTASICLAQFV